MISQAEITKKTRTSLHFGTLATTPKIQMTSNVYARSTVRLGVCKKCWTTRPQRRGESEEKFTRRFKLCEDILRKLALHFIINFLPYTHLPLAEPMRH